MFITAYAAAANPAASGSASMVSSLVMLVLMFVVFYFILIRPQKKKEKELKNMLAALKVGDEVATIGGIHGKITRIKDDLFVLESGIGTNKSYITVDRSAVSRFLKRGEEQAPTPIPGEGESAEETKE
ncbi:MAG: preprotein translocase subunit YajC [Clostridia bacterium]|nr:preprotein translocase subunit YajC [Clostridia bacterium]